MKESQMYEPIKAYLEGEGYRVRAEVKDADIVAIKGQDMVIIEMKTKFSLKFVYQLVDRQRMTDKVYAAVLVNYKTRWGKSFQNMSRLLKRLSLGLIIVYEKRQVLQLKKCLIQSFVDTTEVIKRKKS